ncbi:MAG: thioredoxin domain-containing protein, partial [Planctomycetota bacterium]
DALVKSFARKMNVLCMTGTWCGDCALQGSAMARVAEAIKINDGLRVPVAIFMAEDFEPVSLYGDRSLVRYRAMAARNLGAACPLPGAPVDPDEAAATLQDWLDEFERVQLLLRLSTRLRQKHGN